MSQVTLHYFDGRGKGEIIRFMLSAAGIKFNEAFLTKREEMVKLITDGLLDFNQLPLLDIDGLRLVQTGAIVRYIARRGGLYGKDDKEAALIAALYGVVVTFLGGAIDCMSGVDKFFEGAKDFNDNYLPLGFRERDVVLGNVKEKVLPRYLPAFEKALQKNGTGYLVGSSLTMADVGLLEATSNTIEFIGADALKDYLNLQQFYKTVSSIPNISAFLKGPQRKRANDERYVADVKRVLAW